MLTRVVDFRATANDALSAGNSQGSDLMLVLNVDIAAGSQVLVQMHDERGEVQSNTVSATLPPACADISLTNLCVKQVIPGRALADCVPVTGSSLATIVQWRSHDHTVTLPPRGALRFVFRGDIHLYSFWFN